MPNQRNICLCVKHQICEILPTEPIFCVIQTINKEITSNFPLLVRTFQCSPGHSLYMQHPAPVQMKLVNISKALEDLSRWWAVLPLLRCFISPTPPGGYHKKSPESPLKVLPVACSIVLGALSPTSRCIPGLTLWCAVFPILSSHDFNSDIHRNFVVF